MKSKLLIVLVLLLGLFIRFYQINQLPPSLNWDEISHGYNAYSILKTGKDEWGISFPTIFRCFGEREEALNETIEKLIARGWMVSSRSERTSQAYQARHADSH